MASPSKKPRDIKNLKARLGRTITPGQAGLPQGPGGLPGAPPIGGSVPPPSIGGGIQPPTAAQPHQPQAPGRPSAPPGGLPAPTAVRPAANPLVGGLPAPSIGGAPQGRPQQPAPGGPLPGGRPAGGGGDPFGAANPAAVSPADKKVTLVIDDSAVDQGEIGRKSTLRSVVLIVVGAALGVAAGWGVGSTYQERNQFNMAVRDGKDIHAKVSETAKTMEQVKKQIAEAMKASQSGPGKTASVNYDAVKALVGLERPFTANEFHRRRYRAFPPNVVDDLFDYYNTINLLWDKFALLGAKTAGNKKKALDESAKAADGLIKTQYGMVLSKAGDNMVAGLVYVQPGDGEQKEGEPPIVKVASAQGGRTVDRKLFFGKADLTANYDKYVIMLDKMRSREILGQGADLFGEYQALLMEINALHTKATEAQGRLIKELGKVASLAAK